MIAPNFLADWITPLEAAPIPEEFAEPMQRLLGAFAPNTTVFLLQARTPDAQRWLTVERIVHALHSPLTEAAQQEAWALTQDAWAVRVRVPSHEEEAAESPLWVHTLRHALHENLWNSYREANGNEDGSPFRLQPLIALRPNAEIEDHVAQLNALLDILVNKQLRPQFQPIVQLTDGQVFGYEALIRGPKGGDMRKFGAMFHAADKASMVSWFDIACLEQCFAYAAQNGLRKRLFVNMEAEGLSYLDLNERSLALRAREYGLNPAQIVIEITERQAVEDFPQLMQYIARLREQGFKIAIDDAGAGYNSLYTIAEARPDFVKIDRSLTRNLNTAGERRALLASLVRFARRIGTDILAEGAETREELAILIELGVAYGQGYLMGKPADDLRGVPRQTREFIQERNALYGKMSLGRRVAIGELARRTVEMPTDTPLGVAAAKFARDATLTSVVVLEEERPRGLLMRNQLDHVLDLAKAAQLAALLPDDTIEQWIRTNLLFVQASVSIQEAAHQLTTRSDLSMETDIVVVNSENEYVGVVSPRLLLEHALMVQENQRRYADSLTGLPNRVALEQEIASRLNERQPMAVLYADLTGFRLYNQAFGAAHGDEVLYEMKRLCLHALEQGAGGDGYLAHLSGDDFILMTEPNAGQAVGRALIAGFEPLLKQFYREEQWRQGHIELEERNGNRRNVPLMRLHVVGLTSAKSRLTHYGQIMEDLYRLMQQAQRNANARLLLDDGR